jgi:predicted aldo/keto reductase-like oxidoreductase
MNQNNDHGVSRRDFVRAGVTAAALAGLSAELAAQQPEEGGKTTSQPSKAGDLVPTRVLGKTGASVSVLNLGTTQKPDNRMLNAMYDCGIRYIDTADCYVGGQAEQIIAGWMTKKANRKDIFLVTKDHPKSPDEWIKMLDKRLEALKTDFVDLFFIHMLGEGSRGGPGNEDHAAWPKSKEWAAAAEKMKKSGKIRFAGFSTHTGFPLRTELLNNAAAGGWVDALMVAYDPQLVRDNADFNKALDACHNAKIGLISMKQMRGVKDAPKFMPEFEKKGLTAHTAVLNAVWTDERIASICCNMPNLEILKENTTAARNFKPLDKKEMAAVIGLYEQRDRRFCNACDGRCRQAAGTDAALNDIVRLLSYYEMDGRRDEARRLFAAMSPEERDWHGADLQAASCACVSKLDFEKLLARAEQKLA